MTTITRMSINLPSGGLGLTHAATLDRIHAVRASPRLPKRGQAVLWHTEIEGETPSDVVPILGLMPAEVAVLAYRARAGVRQADLQVRLTEAANQHRRCRTAVEKLGAWIGGGFGSREKAQVQTHLDEGDSCHRLAAELRQVTAVMDRCA